MNDQAVVGRVVARCDLAGAGRCFELDQADAARTVGRQPALMTERRDRDTHLAGGFQYGRTSGHLGPAAVDAQNHMIG